MPDRKQLNSLRLNNGMVYGNVVDYATLLWICTNRTDLSFNVSFMLYKNVRNA